MIFAAQDRRHPPLFQAARWLRSRKRLLLRALPSCVTAAGCFRKRASLDRGGRSRLHPRIPLFIRSAGTGNRLFACSPFPLAKGEGFEPPEAFTSTVFKTAAIDRSAILPYRPPQMAAGFCCLRALSRRFLGSARFQITFSSGAPHSEHAPKRRPSCKTPFSSGAPLSEPVQAPFSTVCAEEEERQSACARVRADDVPDVVILDLMPREIGF